MSIGRELRHGIRILRREPIYAATAILALALGIGANAAMVGLVDRLLLSPPAGLRDPGNLVRFGLTFATTSGQRFTMETTSYPIFRDFQTQARSYTGFTAIAAGSMVLGEGEQARSVAAAKVSGGYFTVLGAEPGLGRFFGEPDDVAPNGTAVAVLSHRFWRRAFGADPGILGHEITLDEVSYHIIGVAPPDFTGPGTEPIDVWVPLNAAQAGQPPTWRESRNFNVVGLLGRLRDGVPREAAEAEGSEILRRGLLQAGRSDDRVSLELRPIVAGIGDRSTSGRIALWLAGVSFVVFFIAVANVANLILVQGVRRRREIAVRSALGASRGDLIRQLVIESLLLATLGGLGASVVAVAVGEAIRALLVPNLAAADTVIPGRLVWLVAAGAAVSAILVGLLPAIRASRPSLVDDLKASSQGATAQRWSWLTALLVIQGGLSAALLVGAGLFVSSLHRVRTQDLGFTATDVYLATMAFHRAVPGSTQDALYHQAEDVVRRLPGVDQVSIAQAVPFGGHHIPPIAVPGREDFPDPNQQLPFLYAATPAYFRVLGLRLLEGRNFAETDREGSQLVVIVNEAMARGLWPHESPLGRCLRAGFAPGEVPTGMTASPTLPCRTVVGVVNNARPRSIREEAGQARMQYYIPFGQIPGPPDVIQPRPPDISSLLIRTSGAPGVPEAIRRAMQGFAPRLPLTEVVPLQDLLDKQIHPWTLGAAVFTGLGLLALLLASVGMYGVRAYLVAQRAREIGVRLALGAAPRSVSRLVLFDGLRVMLAGLVLGLAAVALAGHWIAPLLFETSPADPMTLAVVVITLAIVTVVACLVPAWRAASVAPSQALRAD